MTYSSSVGAVPKPTFRLKTIRLDSFALPRDADAMPIPMGHSKILVVSQSRSKCTNSSG